MDLGLHEAARQGHHERVQKLLAAGADVEATDAGRTAPYLAADAGQPLEVELLLAAGADVEAANAEGRTALYVAAAAGHGGVMELLLAAGASVNVMSANWQTPLFVASLNGHAMGVQILLRNGAKPQMGADGRANSLHAAALGCRGCVLQQLLEAWGRPEITAYDLVGAAEFATHNPCVEAFTYLAKELYKLDPEELRQLVKHYAGRRMPATAVVVAVLEAWAEDVSSLDEQQAAVRKREEGVACEQQVLQQLIVAVAGMAKHIREDPPEEAHPVCSLAGLSLLGE